MSTKFSPQDQEEVRAQLLQSIKAQWSLQDLEMLSHLYQDHNWSLFQKWLGSLEEALNDQVWNNKTLSLEQLYFLRGQRRVLNIINRLPHEIEKSKQMLKEDFEQTQKEQLSDPDTE